MDFTGAFELCNRDKQHHIPLDQQTIIVRCENFFGGD
jgi:hypothetical protein